MQASICRAGVDRLQLLAKPLEKNKLPEFVGFRRVRDSFVRSQTAVKTYARAAEYVNDGSGLRVFLQHHPVLPTLWPLKVTLIPNDQSLLASEDTEAIVAQFSSYRISLLEFVLDWFPESGIDLAFVKAHALFGKSRPIESRLHARSIVYGSRKGEKFVRCYSKKNIGAFRIELEFHSGWLRRHQIAALENLRKLPRLLYAQHVRFVKIDWIALERYVARRGHPHNRSVIQQAKTGFESIHRAMQFLRTNAQVTNVHRFVVPLPIDREIRRAMNKWPRNL
jgi:hypothetical protein